MTITDRIGDKFSSLVVLLVTSQASPKLSSDRFRSGFLDMTELLKGTPFCTDGGIGGTDRRTERTKACTVGLSSKRPESA